MSTVHLGVRGKPKFDLSAVAQVGEELWVGSDETKTIYRLKGGPDKLYDSVGELKLKSILDLPFDGDGDEIDIEGMDCLGGYVWVVGSHSLKRVAPKASLAGAANLDGLNQVVARGNRYLLARIPADLASGEKAAQLDNSELRNDLSDLFRQDRHLKRFLADTVQVEPPASPELENKEGRDALDGIPSKDNGIDIESIACVSPNRVFVGLRGPVLRGWAIILDLQFDDGEIPEGNKAKHLKLTSSKLRKIFVRLDGLGIRDMCFVKDDLLILAGPTMDLDWPVTIYRWKGARAESKVEERLVWQESDKPTVDSAQTGSIVVELVQPPTVQKGRDHAEGLTVIGPAEGPKMFLVIHDSPADWRVSSDDGILADIIDLP